MADDLNSSLAKAESTTAKILSNLTGANQQAQQMSQNLTHAQTGGGGGQQIANYNSPTQYTYNPPPPTNTNFNATSQGAANYAWATKALGKGVASLMALMPSAQETVQMSTMAERMRFYSNNMGQGGLNPQSRANNVPLYQYSIMNNAMRMGTAIGPDDALQAINDAAPYGLNTGLRNFNAGGGFAGILGGAALASNLAPGIGITGGMGVVANINQAQNVNMLRMLGVQVRGNNGSTMNDLPQIIEQLYGVLTRNNPNPTPEDVATSLMSGNALDSLINQYFGNDLNTRKVIVSGLLQRIKAGDLRRSGSRGALGLTGGSNTAVSSLAMRNTAEGQLIQGLSETTNKAMVGTNNLIQAVYRQIGGLGLTDNMAGDVLRGAQQITTALTTFGGIRGGAGANILSNISDASAAAFYKQAPGKKAGKVIPRFGTSAMKRLLLGAPIAGIAVADIIGHESVQNALGQETANMVDNLSQLPSVPGSARSTVGNQFTGAITINVSVPPGADPYAYKAALVDVFT